MSVIRKGRYPFNATSLKRNQELRGLLLHLEATPNQTVLQIAAHTTWSQAKSRNAVDTLRAANLIYASSTSQSGFKSVTYHYSIVAHDDSDLNIHLPLVRPPEMPEAGHRPVAVSKTRPNAIMRRDPMVELLMGAGRAPSMNFIDSPKESKNAEPKTTGAPH